MSLIHEALRKASVQRGGEHAPVPTPGGDPFAPPEARENRSRRIVVGLVVLLVCIAAGWFVYPLFSEVDEDAAVVEAEAAAAAQAAREARAQQKKAEVEAERSAALTQERLTQDAETLFSNGRYDEALPLYQELAAVSPSDLSIQNNVGLTLFHLDRFDEALEVLDAVLAQNADHPEALNNKSLILTERGDALEAALLLRQAVHVAPEYADAHFNLGLLMEEQGNWRSAYQSYLLYLQYAQGIDPDFRDAIELRIEDLSQ